MSQGTCIACSRPLVGNVVIFCSECYWQIPAPERASLRGMWLRKENTDSKVAKCVRILNQRKQSNEQRTTDKPSEGACAALV